MLHRILVPAAPLLWVVVLGSIGWFYGWTVLGHPHAWQLLPFIGVTAGLVVAAAHWLVLIVVWYRKRHRERDA